MRLLDINVLVAALRTDHVHHGVARPWLMDLIASEQPFAIPTISALGCARVAANPKAFDQPTPVGQGLAFIAALREQRGHVRVEPGSRHWSILTRLCDELGVGPRLLSDAHLAALAVEHHGTLVSLDRDFARFTGLQWEMPQPPAQP